MPTQPPHRLCSQLWFDDPSHADMTTPYVKRFMNYGLTHGELQSGRPIIGIAQTGNDLAPCNRHHLELTQHVKAGIRDTGGIPMEFPVHPLAGQSRHPTATLDRNLAYLGLVEIFHGFPLDSAVLTTGCDKTAPACLIAAAAMGLPAIVLSGGPVLDGWRDGKWIGSGTVIWRARNRLVAGDIDYEGFMELTTTSSPSIGHCSIMGTTLSISSLAEALGMSLPGCTSIPAAYRERGQMAYATDKRVIDLAHKNVRPSTIITRLAFENVVMVASALSTSTNCPSHLIAIVRHMGVELSLEDWQRHGELVPLLVSCMPAGEYSDESFHRSDGVPAVLRQLNADGLPHRGCPAVSGRTIGAIADTAPTADHEVIFPVDAPPEHRTGFIVLSGDFFDSAIMRMSMVGEAFRQTYLSGPGAEDVFETHTIVFDDPKNYHTHINDPTLAIDERCILVTRGCDTIDYPDSAEVVNMAPPAALVKQEIESLPCMGDGRQSGTSANLSILNMSSEAAADGGLALPRTGDHIRVDLNTRRVDVLVDTEELEHRRKSVTFSVPQSRAPWQEIYRQFIG